MKSIVEKTPKPLTIKVCGMRDPQNIADLIQLPIDYIGFIFYEKSPRYVTSIPDVTTFEKLPNLKHIKRVGVFVNADIDFVLTKIEQFSLDVVQLHGKETPQYLRELKMKNEKLTSKDSSFTEVWKAFSVDETFDFETTTPYENIADKFLFDTKTPQHGGSGQKFDWHILKKYEGKTPFFLSGGISAADTEGVKNIGHSQLFGLDINSKFEISPALKDVPLLKKFIDSVLTR